MRRLFGAVFALLVMSVGAQAQDTFPNKPIQMVVPFPPGGVADITGQIGRAHV